MSYTLAIKNGLIIDGSGNKPYISNIYTDGDRIAAITAEDLEAERIVDAHDLAAAPGFIDIHTHSDSGPWDYPGFEGRLHQGVTTDIAGNCGGSMLPRKPSDRYKVPVTCMKEAATDLGNRRFGANYNSFVGHGNLRSMAMADKYAVDPTPEELEKMKELLDGELAAGAVGLSIGLEYMPGYYCRTEELVELAKVVKKHGKLCSVHMRNEAGGVFEAVDEVAEIARRSGAHMHISHLKIMFSDNWGRADDLLAHIDGYRSQGLNITADQYPFLATSTSFRIMMPAWSKTGTGAEITDRIRGDETWLRMKDDVLAGMNGRGGPSCVVVASTGGRYREIEGKSLEEIGRELQMEPIDAFRCVMLKCNSGISGIYHSINREDALKIMARSDIAVISDSSSRDFVTGAREGCPHPRSTSSAVKFLRTVRENSLMPIEKAVYKLTSLPASIIGLEHRGLIKEDYFADIVIFDPETAADRGTFGDPFRTSVGVREVFVNGVSSWKDGMPTGNMAGRFVPVGG